MNIERARKLVEEGNSVGFSILGCCYLDGIEVDVDYNEAFRLLSTAAERRVPRAMYNLARMYAGGLGVEKSMSEAIRLYEAAARAGEFIAQIDLARIYHDGIGIRKRPAAARKWYSVVAAWEGQIGAFEELQEAKERSASASPRKRDGRVTKARARVPSRRKPRSRPRRRP